MGETVPAGPVGPTRSSGAVHVTDVGWVPPRVLAVALTEAFGVRRATAALTSLDVHGSATVPMRTLRAADQACATLRAWSLRVLPEARP